MARKRIAFIPGFLGTNLYKYSFNDLIKIRCWVSGTTFTGAGLRALRLGDNPGDGDSAGLVSEEVNQGVYSPFLEFLVSQGHDVQAYGYDWRRSSSSCVDRIRLALRIAASSGLLDAVICHSYGGCLVGRALAQLLPAERQNIKQVITVGSPFRGSFHPGTSLAGYGESVKFMSVGVAVAQFCLPEEAKSRVTNTLSSWDSTYTLMPSSTLINELVHAPFEWTRQSNVWVHAGYWHNGPKGTAGAADMDAGWTIPVGMKHTAIIGTSIPTPGPFNKPREKYGDNGHSWIDGDGVVPVASARPANGNNAEVWTVVGEHDRLCSSSGTLEVVRNLLR